MLKISKESPKITLQPEYVIGYRCQDSRNNLFFTSKAEIVYMTAALGIVLDYNRNEQKILGG